MKEFLKKELYSFRAVAAILARWLLLAVPTGLVCGAVGTAFHLSVEYVTELRATQSWLLLCLPAQRSTGRGARHRVAGRAHLAALAAAGGRSCHRGTL